MFDIYCWTSVLPGCIIDTWLLSKLDQDKNVTKNLIMNCQSYNSPLTHLQEVVPEQRKINLTQERRFLLQHAGIVENGISHASVHLRSTYVTSMDTKKGFVTLRRKKMSNTQTGTSNQMWKKFQKKTRLEEVRVNLTRLLTLPLSHGPCRNTSGGWR